MADAIAAVEAQDQWDWEHFEMERALWNAAQRGDVGALVRPLQYMEETPGKNINRASTGKPWPVPPLWVAASNDHLGAVSRLLGARADVNARGILGSTPLMATSHHGNLNCAEELILAKASLAISDNLGRTALHCASRTGYCAVARELLRAKAALDPVDDAGTTPLLTAATSSEFRMVQLLVQARAVVDTAGGWASPLWMAAAAGCAGTVRVLLAAKADTGRVDRRSRRTALTAATVHSHPAVVNLLVLAKAAVGREALSVAADHGDIATMQLLLRARAEVDARADGQDATALAKAAQRGHEAALRVLLRAKAAVEGRVAAKCPTPLWQAAEGGRVRTVQLLLQAKASVDRTGRNGETPLHVVARRGDVAMLRLLLCAKANVGCPDLLRRTALWVAAATHRRRVPTAVVAAGQAAEGQGAEVVHELVKAGACVDQANIEGQSPLWAAATAGQAARVQVLVDARADLDAVDDNGETPLCGALQLIHGVGVGGANAAERVPRLLLRAKASVNSGGSAAVTTAARSGNAAAVRMLVHAKAAVNAHNTITGATPLTAAAEVGGVGMEATVAALAAAKADLDAADRRGDAPLHVALRRSRLLALRALLAAKASVDRRDRCGNGSGNGIGGDGNGDTPLCLAVGFNDAKATAALLAAKADVDRSGRDGRTPLLAALSGGRLAATRLLLAAKACANQRQGSGGETPLWVTVRRNHPLLVQALLGAKAAVNDVVGGGGGGATALHLAASTGLHGVARLLAEAGADLACVDGRGYTPWEAAAAGGLAALASTLMPAPAPSGDSAAAGAPAVAAAAAARQGVPGLCDSDDMDLLDEEGTWGSPGEAEGEAVGEEEEGDGDGEGEEEPQGARAAKRMRWRK